MLRLTCVSKLRIGLLVLAASIAAISCQQPQAKSVARQPPLQVVESAESEMTFIAVGDIMLSRGVARAMSRANDPLLPFSRLGQLLSKTDFNFGNLESPFSGKDQVVGKGLVFNARRRHLEGLTAYNFKILNLANNHALDQHPAGLRQTRMYLEENGIDYLGVGDNKDDAWRPKVISVRGMKIGFIGASYSSFNDGGTERNDYVARIEETGRLRQAITRLKAEADFIVVTMHAGTEYVRRPNQSQVSFAREAIDAGADLVIGAHPHWIQTVEFYKGRCIFYSLGNFIFDQGFSRETKEGLMLKVTLRKKRDGVESVAEPNGDYRGNPPKEAVNSQIELIPVIIEGYSTPRQATAAEAEQILRKINVPGQCINSQVGTADK